MAISANFLGVGHFGYHQELQAALILLLWVGNSLTFSLSSYQTVRCNASIRPLGRCAT